VIRLTFDGDSSKREFKGRGHGGDRIVSLSLGIRGYETGFAMPRPSGDEDATINRE
jgi:hypothetical protein